MQPDPIDNPSGNAQQPQGRKNSALLQLMTLAKNEIGSFVKDYIQTKPLKNKVLHGALLALITGSIGTNAYFIGSEDDKAAEPKVSQAKVDSLQSKADSLQIVVNAQKASLEKAQEKNNILKDRYEVLEDKNKLVNEKNELLTEKLKSAQTEANDYRVFLRMTDQVNKAKDQYFNNKIDSLNAIVSGSTPDSVLKQKTKSIKVFNVN